MQKSYQCLQSAIPTQLLQQPLVQMMSPTLAMSTVTLIYRQMPATFTLFHVSIAVCYDNLINLSFIFNRTDYVMYFLHSYRSLIQKDYHVDEKCSQILTSITVYAYDVHFCVRLQNVYNSHPGIVLVYELTLMLSFSKTKDTNLVCESL